MNQNINQNMNQQPHKPNVMMNQHEVDDMIDDACEPKHLNFEGIPDEQNVENNSPFKEGAHGKADRSLGSGMKNLSLMSNKKEKKGPGRPRKN